MPRYFLDLPEEPAPIPWEVHAGPRPERADTRYFGAAFAAMERGLRDPDIDVYLTWDTERLPAYGPRVVAVLLGDEAGRIPRYAGRVRAVFKSYGLRPQPGTRLRGASPVTAALELAQRSVHWLRWLPGGARQARARLTRAGQPGVMLIPLGTYNQVDLPVTPIAERPTDLFFAGSVEHEAGLRYRLASPKARSRREMIEAVDLLARGRPGLRTDIRLTEGFTSSEDAAEGYSQALMDARVCLAPRGNSAETFRVFEGLRAGCVVVSERLPRFWFYDGGPILQIDSWSQLGDVVEPLLDDPAELERLHAASLDWWREKCSEEALGRLMAERLNRL
ncbi:MAG: hypothetical protein JW895_09750 [Thermoleophilaceae bacterium]|nr:hypothetical protein [Thermoleophilaceae bacterium]